jgi:hypothetical protein
VGRHAKVIGVKLFRLVTTPEHERRKRLQKFPQRRRVGLQRSQIRYATSILNLVIAVAQCASPFPLFLCPLTWSADTRKPASTNVASRHSSTPKILCFVKSTERNGPLRPWSKDRKAGRSQRHAGSTHCPRDRMDTEAR